MDAPGLTDIYAFGDWLKKYYTGSQRKPLFIGPIQGGLIHVSEIYPCKKCGRATWGNQYDPVNLEQICESCYAL